MSKDCLTLLRDGTMLKKCTFFDITDREPVANTSVVHPSLDELTMSGDVDSLAPFLVLPALRVLCIAPACDWIPISLAWFCTMPLLSELTLDRIADEFIYDFLSLLNRAVHPRFLPQIQRLKIRTNYVTIDGRVLDALRSGCAQPDSKSGTSAVHLESLRIICEQPDYHICRDEADGIDWGGLEALYDRGLDIHVGPKTQNFLEER